MSSGLGARTVALKLLDAVLRRRQPLDDALARNEGFASLDRRDRAFARQLTTTTLRRLGQIDALIDGALDRPLKPKLAGLRDILRLGVCQLAFLGTPPHAAVSTSVNLTERSRLSGHRAFVNAVLRRLAREAPEAAAARDESGAEAQLNTPAWLWESWRAAYGEATAKAIAEAHLKDPPLDLSLKDPAAAEAWAERLQAEVLPTGGLRLPPASGEIAKLPGYDKGAWWVQDAAAALPARLLGDIRGRRIIDLCAAPGGKTAQLAAAGAEVTAVDRNPARLEQLARNLQRLDLPATVVEADARQWRPPSPCDGVLLDAPCSATGTMRRHPDIAHLKDPEAMGDLTTLQDALLAAAVEMTAAGGFLVYAACSLQPEEGPERIARLLAAGAPIARDPLRPGELAGLEALITPEGDLRSLPCHWPALGGLDGFYACRLRRLSHSDT